jgi:NADH-quinone oxidoreductase subunit E
MQVPATLEAKYNQLIGRYPVKRSALIPMMLYAQDEFGSLSDEVLADIAERLDLNMTQVTETLAYYSMLRRKPAGKFHIQVCTNISCMLRGGQELYEHVQKRLGIGNKQVSQTGTFSLEEVECIGACTGAPAMQVNYDYYENLDPDKVDAIFEQLQDGRIPPPVAVISGALHPRASAEIPVISQRFGIKNSRSIERRLSGPGKSSHADDSRPDHRRNEEVEPAGSRRRGLSHRHEVEFRPQEYRQAEVHPGER